MLNKTRVIFFLLVTMMMALMPAVLAAHDTDISLAPTLANCGDLDQIYTITITNNGSADDIREVRIYDDVDLDDSTDLGIESFECGAAPSGWTLTDRLNDFHYCEYLTPVNGLNKIESGESLDFTFTATLSDTNLICGNEFRISTIDDNSPVGEVKFKFPMIAVDCSDPIITKHVGDPKVDCDETLATCDWWVTNQTLIELWATDNTDECDLGIDYCLWQITLDGVPGPVINQSNGEELHWDFTFEGDSNHLLEVECFDVAGNTVTLTELDKVDSTKPVTTKSFDGPQKFEQGQNGVVEWIDGVTTVDLDPVDPDPTGESCNIGIDKTWYLDVLVDDVLTPNGLSDPDDVCYNPDLYCDLQHLSLPNPYDDPDTVACINSIQESCHDDLHGASSWEECVIEWSREECQLDSRWLLWNGTPIEKDEESCHVLAFFSVDHLGNVEDMNLNCFFVDKKPPVVDKQVGTPSWPGDGFTSVRTTTDITFTCTDQLPHPSGDEELCYKVSFDSDGDMQTDSFLTQQYCGQQALENDWCCVSATPNAPFIFNFQEESFHDLEYFCRDAVDKESEIEVQYYKVDDTPPVITKVMFGDNHLGYTDGVLNPAACPPRPEEPNDECYVADNNENGVTITAVDPEPEHASNELTCRYEVFWLVTEDECNAAQYSWNQPLGKCVVEADNFDPVAGKTVIFKEDSTHELLVYCQDALGNSVEDVETFLVDSTPPNTNKILGEPLVLDYFPKGCVPEIEDVLAITNGNGVHPPCGVEQSEWITSQTPVTLEFTDNKVGVAETKWRNLLVLDPIAGEQICGHQHGTPNQQYFHDYCDPDYYRDFVDNSTPWNDYVDPFFKPEESCHVIEYYSTDLLGNKEPLQWNCLFVDNTFPEAWKEVGEPKKLVNPLCDPELELCDYFISQETPINIFCRDTEPHPVDHVSMEYRYRVSDDCVNFGEWGDWLLADTLKGLDPYLAEAVVRFTEDSCHEIEFKCVDGLGNAGPVFSEVDIVETVPPETELTLVDPVYNNGTATWIDTASRVRLDAVDPDPHPSGWMDTYYRWSLVDDVYCQGNEEGDADFATWYVNGGLTSDGPDGESSSANEGQWAYTDFPGTRGSGSLQLSIDNAGVAWRSFLHRGMQLSDITTLSYSTYSTNGNSWPTLQVEWDSDCNLSTDGYQGNLVFIPADNTDTEGDAPTSGEWQTWDALAGSWRMSQDGFASLTSWADLMTANPDACLRSDFGRLGVKVGTENTQETAYTDNVVLNDNVYDFEEQGTFLVYDGEFGIPEESCHMLQYFSTDMLQNDEAVQTEYVFVDKQAPEIVKRLGQPSWTDLAGNEYVNTETPVHVWVEDPQPHPSGVSLVEYRVTLVNDTYCEHEVEDFTPCEDAQGSGDFTSIAPHANFTLGQESCHLIEIHAVDNVQKESWHKQCVFVDDTAPLPNKTVGDPKDPMSQNNIDLGEAFFPGMNETCQTPGGCWDITLMTPLDLACNDPEPHPSGATDICFKVELDGEDVTEYYCNEGLYDGNYDQNGDGFCCLEGGVDSFMFNEESWHKLSYYCEDNVGNSGSDSVDTEYFKVEGAPFSIYLYKKWNLISVPFVLLNNSPETVFGDLENLDSVWTYDSVNEQWLVWSPEGPNSLTSVVPGWGYWVLMVEDETMTIGGSLLQPGVLPPFRPLKPGWNLIGPYGTQWQQYNDLNATDKNFMCGDEGEDKADIFGSDVYCQLNSLVDTQQGFPRWSALWSYVNCGDHEAGWTGLNACLTQFDKMYAGRGYWIELDVEDIFAPATTCVWNGLNYCANQGPIILA